MNVMSRFVVVSVMLLLLNTRVFADKEKQSSRAAFAASLHSVARDMGGKKRALELMALALTKGRSLDYKNEADRSRKAKSGMTPSDTEQTEK